MVKNKQSNLIASVKMLNIGLINKHIINLGIGGWGLLSISLLPITCLKIFFVSPLTLPFIFLYKDRRNRLLCVSFYELYDFMIYQHVNKRAKNLSLATFHIAHFCKHSIRFALPISMPRFKSINFYQNSPKIKLFLKKKCKIVKCWGLRPQTPAPPVAGNFPPDPQNSPPNCEFLATRLPRFALFIIIWVFLAFVLNNFFNRSVANLMMLTKDVCLVLNCFLFEKFYLHYALIDFDSILLHCTKLFICQSIDREQIFDVTFQTPH